MTPETQTRYATWPRNGVQGGGSTGCGASVIKGITPSTSMPNIPHLNINQPTQSFKTDNHSDLFTQPQSLLVAHSLVDQSPVPPAAGTQQSPSTAYHHARSLSFPPCFPGFSPALSSSIQTPVLVHSTPFVQHLPIQQRTSFPGAPSSIATIREDHLRTPPPTSPTMPPAFPDTPSPATGAGYGINGGLIVAEQGMIR